MKPFTLFFIAVAGVMIFAFFINKRNENINKTALEDLNLKLTGIVTDVKAMNNTDSLGIITTTILNTNIMAYDPRDSIEFYYCVIKNGTAELYDNAYKKMIGDTIIIDTKKKLECWGGQWNEKAAKPININTNKNYYDYIRRNTRFKPGS